MEATGTFSLDVCTIRVPSNSGAETDADMREHGLRTPRPPGMLPSNKNNNAPQEKQPTLEQGKRRMTDQTESETSVGWQQLDLEQRRAAKVESLGLYIGHVFVQHAQCCRRSGDALYSTVTDLALTRTCTFKTNAGLMSLYVENFGFRDSSNQNAAIKPSLLPAAGAGHARPGLSQAVADETTPELLGRGAFTFKRQQQPFIVLRLPPHSALRRFVEALPRNPPKVDLQPLRNAICQRSSKSCNMPHAVDLVMPKGFPL